MSADSSQAPDGDRSPDGGRSPTSSLVGGSPAMQHVNHWARQIARSRTCALVQGEPGVGKTLLAHAVHRLSDRSGGPLATVDCRGFDELGLASELFGHVRGAFAGAVGGRVGCVESLGGGTLVLNEIGALPLRLQTRLLGVVQGGSFTRLGDTRTRRADIRLIATNSGDLLGEVEAQRFREDLYWRLNVAPITVPPLRMRREDIPELVEHFLRQLAERADRPALQVHPDVHQALQDYHWPGNVRELQSYVERAVVLTEDDTWTPALLPGVLTGRDRARRGQIQGVDLDTLVVEVVQQGLAAAGPAAADMHERIVNRVERELIVQVLAECNRVQTKAAARLGINRNTLRKKLADYQIEDAENPPSDARRT